MYLYKYAGEPWKTQKWVWKAVDALFGPNEDGLCGDEEKGQMSAWYIVRVPGFYPVKPDTPAFVIASPRYEKITLTLPTGKTLIISAVNNSAENMYFQSVTLNGVRYDHNWLSYTDIVNGGTLEFTMGFEPNKQWVLMKRTHLFRFPLLTIRTVCQITILNKRKKAMKIFSWLFRF